VNKKQVLLVSIIIISCILFSAALNAISTNIVSAQGDSDFYIPIVSHSNQPLTSNSYYMTTADEDFLYELGCELGNRDQVTPGTQDSVAVLDFSYPICDPELGFGADLFIFEPVPLNEIEAAVKQFASGYYTCTGIDHQSNLVIGVGTNNKSTSCDNEEKAASHGAAWAEMVNRLNQLMIDEGIFHQVQAYGASDIEVGWGTPEWSHAWVDGYDEANQYPLLHFGDAAGCPSSESSTSTSCGLNWTMEDVWYVSWGAPPSLPLPLIYRTDGIQAKQWAHLSRYSVNQHSTRMEFTGVFTQSQACEQAGTCESTDNKPYQAYRQLSSELNKYPETAMELMWKTDIRWILSNEFSKSVITTDINQNDQYTSPYETVIEQFQMALNNPDLSPLMQASLNEKLQSFKRISRLTNESRLNPAKK